MVIFSLGFFQEIYKIGIFIYGMFFCVVWDYKEVCVVGYVVFVDYFGYFFKFFEVNWVYIVDEDNKLIGVRKCVGCVGVIF